MPRHGGLKRLTKTQKILTTMRANGQQYKRMGSRNLIVGAGEGERGRSRLGSAEGASVLTIISL